MHVDGFWTVLILPKERTQRGWHGGAVLAKAWRGDLLCCSMPRSSLDRWLYVCFWLTGGMLAWFGSMAALPRYLWILGAFSSQGSWSAHKCVMTKSLAGWRMFRSVKSRCMQDDLSSSGRCNSVLLRRNPSNGRDMECRSPSSLQMGWGMGTFLTLLRVISSSQGWWRLLCKDDSG